MFAGRSPPFWSGQRDDGASTGARPLKGARARVKKHSCGRRIAGKVVRELLQRADFTNDVHGPIIAGADIHFGGRRRGELDAVTDHNR